MFAFLLLGMVLQPFLTHQTASTHLHNLLVQRAVQTCCFTSRQCRDNPTAQWLGEFAGHAGLAAWSKCRLLVSRLAAARATLEFRLRHALARLTPPLRPQWAAQRPSARAESPIHCLRPSRPRGVPRHRRAARAVGRVPRRAARRTRGGHHRAVGPHAQPRGRSAVWGHLVLLPGRG